MWYVQFILFALLMHPYPIDHDLHLSVLEIKVNDHEIELTLKTFLDDLQIAVGLEPGGDIPEHYTSADEMIAEYIQETIKLSVGALMIQSISASAEAVWIEISVPISSPWAEIDIDHSFLTEVYRDQTNVIKIHHQDKMKMYTLDRKNKSATYVK